MSSTQSAKVVAITGGARGIGYHTAKELIGRGHKVAIGDIDEGQLKIAAEDLGIDVAVRLDVTDPASIGNFLDVTEEALGPLDVLINNAGGGSTYDYGNIWELPVDAMDIAFRNNFIINTASLAGELPVPGLATYCGTKFAVIGFTEAARQEYRRSGVNLSTVRPTFTNTELVSGTSGAKGMRNAEPQEIARATAALIERPQPFVRVTRVAGTMVAAMKFVPGRVATQLGSMLGTDTVFLDRVDNEARRAYLERIERS